MVAGDTKKVVVIKNISSNLIEEAILILRSDPAAGSSGEPGKPVQNCSGLKNDFILKEAENIINQYIRENGLKVESRKRRRNGLKIYRYHISANALINCLLIAAVAFLLLIICKFF